MSEDTHQYAMIVFEAVNKRSYRNHFFEHVERGLSNENRLERIAKTFQLPEGTAKSVLTQACKIYLNANNEQKIERYARAIVNYATRAGTLSKLLDLAEESFSKGAERILRLAERFHVPEQLTHDVFNRAYEIATDYERTFKEPEMFLQTAEVAAGQAAGE